MTNSLLARTVAAVVAWLDRKTGGLEIAELFKRASLWDYAQADLQPWDDEPDPDRLSAAFRLSADDPKRAFTELHRLAEAGSSRAINAIGERYYWGRVVPQDRVEGEAWFKRAFDLGERRGLLNYGKALLLRRDPDAAEAVFRAGADAGWGPAFYWLARIELKRRPWLRGKLSAARPLLEHAIDAGSPGARVVLGALMRAGLYGLANIRRGARLMDEDWQEAVRAAQPAKRTADGETVH